MALLDDLDERCTAPSSARATARAQRLLDSARALLAGRASHARRKTGAQTPRSASIAASRMRFVPVTPNWRGGDAWHPSRCACHRARQRRSRKPGEVEERQVSDAATRHESHRGQGDPHPARRRRPAATCEPRCVSRCDRSELTVSQRVDGASAQSSVCGRILVGQSSRGAELWQAGRMCRRTPGEGPCDDDRRAGRRAGVPQGKGT